MEVSFYNSAPMHQWATLQTELLWLYDGEVEHLSPWKVDHQHAYWVWLLRAGSVRIWSDSASVEAHSGQWVVTPNRINNQEFSEDARILSIHFRSQWPSGDNLFRERDGLVFEAEKHSHLEKRALAILNWARDGTCLYNDARQREQMTLQAVSHQSFWRFERLFLQWMIDFSDVMLNHGFTFAESGCNDQRLSRAARCIHESPLDEPFPEKRLQRETGLGRTRLDRLFYRQFGVTMKDYWDRRRLQCAKECLAHTMLTIKEICFRLGFKQPSHFSRWFDAHSGYSPRRYRSEFHGRETRGRSR